MFCSSFVALSGAGNKKMYIEKLLTITWLIVNNGGIVFVQFSRQNNWLRTRLDILHTSATTKGRYAVYSFVKLKLTHGALLSCDLLILFSRIARCWPRFCCGCSALLLLLSFVGWHLSSSFQGSEGLKWARRKVACHANRLAVST